MLFSEPKIPQSASVGRWANIHTVVSVLFSEPKIPQSPDFLLAQLHCARRFSALQRAENSSMRRGEGSRRTARRVSVLFSEPKIPQFRCSSASASVSTNRFQCSSASRKFLNIIPALGGLRLVEFQCSSASRKFLNLSWQRSDWCSATFVSVLFSEPKIPQLCRVQRSNLASVTFQCSSASRKFLNIPGISDYAREGFVSVLFSEPKIPQCKLA